jgi:hypothetical protein
LKKALHLVSDGAAEADSSAALRNDKQKARDGRHEVRRLQGQSLEATAFSDAAMQ